VRTLNRTLAADDLSYRKLLDHLRHEKACRLLADGRVAIAETAFLLGFSELSAFYRAFKRWTDRLRQDSAQLTRSATKPPDVMQTGSILLGKADAR
jgi:AraC-like DNA-binding protein